MIKLRTRRSLALAGSAVALGIALTGCSALNGILGGGDAQRDDDGNVTEDANIDIFKLKLGDCMPASAMTDDETTDTDVVPCADPHGYEVFYEFDLDDGDYPGDEAITGEVETECLPAFGEFIGTDYQDSTLDITWYQPTQDSWDQAHDRKVQCLVYQPSEDGQSAVDVEGSLEGAQL